MRDALRGKTYVSRVHAKLTVADGKLYIENLSTTNHNAAYFLVGLVP